MSETRYGDREAESSGGGQNNELPRYRERSAALGENERPGPLLGQGKVTDFAASSTAKEATPTSQVTQSPAANVMGSSPI